MRRKERSVKTIRSDSPLFKLLSSCRKLMGKNQKKERSRDKKEDFDQEKSDNTFNSPFPIGDAYHNGLDLSSPQRYLHITREIELEFDSSNIPENEDAYWSHYKNLVKSKKPNHASPLVPTKLEQDEGASESSSREEKRKERRSNRFGIPGVIVLGQPLLPSCGIVTSSL